MRHFFYRYPERAHPMAILSAMVVSLSTFYPELSQHRPDEPDEAINIAATRLMSKLRTITRLLVQEIHERTVRLPAARPKVLRQLPEHDVQLARLLIRDQA